MKVTRSLFGEQLREGLEDFGLAGLSKWPSTSLRDLARSSRISACSTLEHVEVVARLRDLVEHRLDKRLAAILDDRHRVGDDEDAERRAGDDDELIGLHQHFEMSAERRVAAENASDGDEKADGEIQDALRSEPSRRICGARLTPGFQQRGQPGTSPSDDRRPGSLEPPASRAAGNVCMQNGLYVAVSAQVALQRRLETIADNIANMNTVGFRATGVSFESELARAGDTTLNYVSPGSNFVSRRAGELVKTDNPLDFAVQGDGWFGIQTPSGTAYTRDGRARIDEFGTAAHAERRSDPRRWRRAHHRRRRGRPPDRLLRRHDQPEWPAGRRDRPLRDRSRRVAEAAENSGVDARQAGRRRSSISPATASCRARSRAPMSIRCAK